jgi:hypothetical protein
VSGEQHPAVVFLRQAHERAEKVARALPRGPWMWMGHWDPGGNFQALEGPDGIPVLRSRAQTGNSSKMEWHPAFDGLLPEPEAVLRRVTNERELLAEHADDEGSCQRCAGPEWASDDADGNREWSRSPEPWPCRTVLLLAQAWGWTAP